jgi:hypothetical protein
MPNKCPVCPFELNSTPQIEFPDKLFDCPNCGKFILPQNSEFLLKNQSNKKTGHIIYYIRTIQRQNEWPSLDSKKLASLLNESKYPSPTQQAINLIL